MSPESPGGPVPGRRIRALCGEIIGLLVARGDTIAVAESLTGWTGAEASGRPLGEVFRIISEASRLPVESPVEKALREGQVVGLANHTLLIARDGTERPIDDSAAPDHGQRDGAAGRREFHGVRQHVPDHLLQAVRIAKHFAAVVHVNGERERLGHGGRPDCVQCGMRDLVERYAAQIEPQLPRFALRQVQQVVDELRQQVMEALTDQLHVDLGAERTEVHATVVPGS